MRLACALSLYHDEVVCDLAETYHIYDYHAIPAHTLAVLVAGLDENSRVQKRLSGVNVAPGTLLLAGIFDDLNALLWNGKGSKPKRIMPTFLTNENDNTSDGAQRFDDPEDFEKRRAEIFEKFKRQKENK